ncbi:hypothetical protein AB9K26_00200 [Psychroserpens sp. XS_ASV72]|uniref:hypothetical protein n=1 Tax=Psychroserpens sp. XS_ASV72 TaxID=3241293 RepID=UPI003516A7E8
MIIPPQALYSFTTSASIDPEISHAVPSSPLLYVASAAVKPSASAQATFSGNNGVVTVASGAGSTSI